MASVADYNVANASGAAVRSDLNNIFQAVVTLNSGTSEPSTMYPFMIWVDTTNNVVKMRNGANDAWLTMPFAMNASNSVDINAGTIDGVSLGATNAITSAVISGDLTVDTSTFKVDSTNNRVGVGTASPDSALHVDGSDVVGRFNSSSGAVKLRFQEGGTARAFVGTLNGSNGFAIFGSDGTTERVRVDSSGNVGIGTASPAYNLEIVDTGSDANINVKTTQSGSSARLRLTGSSTGTSTVMFADENDTNVGLIQYDHTNNFVKFNTADSERMRIDSSGNVGIGTASASQKLEILDTSNAKTRFAYSSSVYGEIGRKSDGNYEFSAYENGANILFGTSTTNGATTERMRIDSSGNVGIGTASPDNKLHVYKGDSGHSWSFDTGDVLIVENSDSASLNIATPNSNSGNILFSDAGERGRGRIVYDHSGDYMAFATSGQSSERMRIDSSGNVLIAATSFNGIDDSSVKGIALRATAGRSIHTIDSGANAIEFNTHNNGNAGEITCTGTSTTYSTSSDYRLKDVKDSIQNGLERTLALNPVEFAWKSDGTISEGFIAHEAQEIFTDAVTGEKDGEKMQGMDYGRITPLLVKAIQEQQEQIEELKQQINELRGN